MREPSSRAALVATFASLTFAGVGFAACVSQDNTAPSGNQDAGPSGTDATVFDSAPATDAPGDTFVASEDAGVDAPLSCGSWSPLLAFDASAWDGAALSTTSSTGASLPGPAPAICQAGFTPAKLLILNNSSCPLDVWWVDWVCQEDFYGTIPPGDSWHVTSSAGDSWRLRAGGSEELLQEIELPSPLDDGGSPAPTIVEYPPSGAGAVDASAFAPSVEVNPDAAACTSWDAGIEYDAGSWDGAPSPLADDAGVLPGPPATVCSLDGDRPYQLMFVSNSGCPVDVYWVDYSCNENFWQTIEIDRNAIANTYATSVWRLRAHGSNELLLEAPILPETAEAGSNVVVRYP